MNCTLTPDRFNGNREAYLRWARDYQRAYQQKNRERIRRVRAGEEPKRHKCAMKRRRPD